LSNFSDWLLFRERVQTRSQKFDDRNSRPRPYNHKLPYSQTNKQQIKTMYIRQKQCSYWKNLEWIWYNQFILISLMLISTLDSRKMWIYYQGIPLTGLTIPHFGACPKLGPGFQWHMLSFFNDRSERWLFVLLIFVNTSQSSFMTYHRVCNKINTTGVTSGAGAAYPSGAPEFTPGL